jgi:hypothetical protein
VDRNLIDRRPILAGSKRTAGTIPSRQRYRDMQKGPNISERKAAVFIWIGAAVFTIGAMLFGH